MTGDLRPSGFFALRTPLLPFDEFLNWSEGVSVSEQDRGLLRQRLRLVITRPEVREAIFITSPEIEQLIDGWVGAPDSGDGRRCERALVRYFSRLTGRATPYGLMAGVALGRVAKETSLVLEGSSRAGRRVTLSTEYLLGLVNRLRQRPEVRAELRYRPNPTIYRVARTIRFIRVGARRGVPDELVSVLASGPVKACLSAAETGASPAEIAQRMKEGARTRGVVEALISAGLLVAAPTVTLTRDSEDEPLLALEALPAASDLAAQVRKVATDLKELSTKPLGLPVEVYRRIQDELPEVVASGKGVQELNVQLTRPPRKADLGEDVVNEIARAIELSHRINRLPAPDGELSRFKERFMNRYGEREVPLLEALDSEIGAGFGFGGIETPLLQDVMVGVKDSPIVWGDREQWLTRQLHEVWRDGAHELVLAARDIEELGAGDVAPLPDDVAAIAVVAARSDDDVAAGRFRVLLKGYGGPAAVGLLAPFGLTDDALRSAVRGHLKAEEALDPGAVFAEIVHLPSDPHADLIARPLLREYEIACVGPSGAPPDRQIELTDLLLHLDGTELALHSQRLNRRIVPRLTSAHNFEFFGSKPYRFLCKLQSQGVQSGNDFWGPLEGLPFLPRVRSGRIILQRARWNLTKESIRRGDAFGSVQEWRRTFHVPRLLAVSEGDRELPVDLDNLLSVESLVRTVQARGATDLLEFFPASDELLVRNPDGRFVHELFVPFVRSRRHAPDVGPDRPAIHVGKPLTYAPGSEWLFVKLYANAPGIDRLLVDEVMPVITELLAAGSADRWFFVRYEDPDFHLRLRLHGHPERLEREVKPAFETLSTRLLQDARVWRVDFSTYEPEVERYGGSEAIEGVERIFQADSDAVVALIRKMRSRDEDVRWRLALFGAHRLLTDFRLDLRERLRLAQSAQRAFAVEQQLTKEDAARVGDRFRREQPQLSSLIEGPDSLDTAGIFDERSARIEPTVGTLVGLMQSRRLTRSVSEIGASLAHMHINRLLPARHREQELVIYDFLARLYRRAQHVGPR